MLVGKWELVFIINYIVRIFVFFCLIEICINRDGLFVIKYKIWEFFESTLVVKV